MMASFGALSLRRALPTASNTSHKVCFRSRATARPRLCVIAAPAAAVPSCRPPSSSRLDQVLFAGVLPSSNGNPFSFSSSCPANQGRRGRLAAAAAPPAGPAVPPEPLPAGPTAVAFRTEEPQLEDPAAPFGLGFAPIVLNVGAARPRPADDPNHGHTWLTHPTPYNPFRTKADEDGWYVEPTKQQRQLAHDLGLPLYGIL